MELKKLRKSIKKTQEEVAKDLKLQKQTYQNYELSKREPDINTLIQLADYFHVTIDSLLGHNVPYLLDKGLLSKNQLDALDLIMELNNENIIRVISYAAGLLATQK